MIQTADISPLKETMQHECNMTQKKPGKTGQNKKRETGFEPAAPTLARWCSTTEPLAHTKYLFS